MGGEGAWWHWLRGVLAAAVAAYFLVLLSRRWQAMPEVASWKGLGVLAAGLVALVALLTAAHFFHQAWERSRRP